ncbi:hypothetical protein [Saccharopolyspora soli]|nr:hypothetical protein [Saccharopolyspora soli]
MCNEEAGLDHRTDGRGGSLLTVVRGSVISANVLGGGVWPTAPA